MKTNIQILNGNQIGGCVTVISTDTAKIVIDFGESLPGSAQEEQIVFDWAKEKPDAVFFTHYHSDHIGRLSEIPKDIPLYMGEISYHVMCNINEHIHNEPMVYLLHERDNIRFIEQNKAITVGDITVTPFSVDHSAFDAYMFLISANGENILHTGDYREQGHRGHTQKNGIDHNVMLDVIRYYVTQNGKRKINALITEGTMMTRGTEKRYSEKDMLCDATSYFKKNKYVFLKISSTNVDSLATFAKAASVNGRTMYVSWYMMGQIEVYRQASRKYGTSMYAFENVMPLKSKPSVTAEQDKIERFNKQRFHMREKGFVIVADGYGERFWDEFADLDCKAIYSLWNGYIEPENKAFNKRLYDFYQKTGAEKMHTSGHAYREFIEQVITAVNPTDAIYPIHTESAEAFLEMNIPQHLKGKIMKCESNKDLLTEMRRHYQNDTLRFPRDIKAEINNGICSLTLLKNRVCSKNMQEVFNCFEGWALTARISLEEQVKVQLCLDENIGEVDYFKSGHLNRFLYRAMKFKEQYDWFMLSDDLQAAVDAFRVFLQDGTFTNNIPTGEADENTHPESMEEARLATGNILQKELEGQLEIGNGAVYRQLPIGLFKNDVSKATSVFTRGKSAIDLWSIKDNTLLIYELKTENKMLGIITEIFFYCNLMADFVLNDTTFKLNQKSGDRGYNILCQTSIRDIKGVLLADEYHPLVNDEMLSLMNQAAGVKITYTRTAYKHIKSIERRNK